MIQVVCWKWRPKPTPGYPEPPCVVDYGPDHVHTLRNMVARHLDLEHEFVCITDDPGGLDSDIRIVPLWDHCIELGGCYNRLYAFSGDMAEIIGPRFVWLDLDCVITNNITSLIDRDDPIIFNSYKGGRRDPDQHYNGAMCMMDAGIHPEIWDRWKGRESIEFIREQNKRKQCTGSDQGWIRLQLGKGLPRWTEDDGVYEARQVGGRLPRNARIVFFAGPRDPTQWLNRSWVAEHYR